MHRCGHGRGGPLRAILVDRGRRSERRASRRQRPEARANPQRGAAPQRKSANAVTLSAFVQTPTAPAPATCASSTSMVHLPSNTTAIRVPANSTRSVCQTPAHRSVDVADRPARAAPGVIERDVVLERVGTGDVVVVAVVPAPDDAAGLVLAARDRLQLDLDEASAMAVPVLMRTGRGSRRPGWPLAARPPSATRCRLRACTRRRARATPARGRRRRAGGTRRREAPGSRSPSARARCACAPSRLRSAARRRGGATRRRSHLLPPCS